jgi:nitroimidazol reductase NimA-like FMN-containing flavoprotein (pyridoxamine 5'-phosphate oxidase superfamily)
MSVGFEAMEFDSKKLKESIDAILKGNKTMTIATVRDSQPHIHNTQFSFDKKYRLYYRVERESETAIDLRTNSSVTIGISIPVNARLKKKCELKIIINPCSMDTV